MIRRIALLLCLVAAPAWADPAVPIPTGYRLDDYNAHVPDSVPGGQTMHTGDLYTLIATAHPVLVDVLPAQRRPPSMNPAMPWMPPAHYNLPGSIWLPDTGRGAVTEALDRWFENELQKATGGDRATPIVFYCRADCWMSWNAARRAAEHGWTRVIWYPDGPEIWAAAGLRLTQSRPLAMD